MTSYTDQALAISRKWNQATESDMVELSVILIEMARLYKEALITASEREAEYNRDRADWTDKAKKDWSSITEAKEIWKLHAEMAYWDYIVMQDKCKAMKLVIDQFNTFISANQTKFRAINNYISQWAKNEEYNQKHDLVS